MIENADIPALSAKGNVVAPAKPLKDFVCWDGEGSMDSRGVPQDYVLFGNSEGNYIQGKRLTSSDCIEFALDQGEEFPSDKYIHVGFAFDYDSNQILNSLSPQAFKTLSEKGAVRWKNYRIEHLEHKWLAISDVRNKARRIKIQDVWGFFQGSFLAAINQYIPNHPLMAEIAKIEDGKAERMNFTYAQIDYIRDYWTTEIALLKALVDQLRTYMLAVDIDTGSNWYGPGAVANSVFTKWNIKDHMAITPDPVRRAAAFAYAGGRFELFHVGRYEGKVYGADINSAYPAGMAKLPSLTEGIWVHNYLPHPDAPLAEFGLYYVKYNSPERFGLSPSPLFHRDHRGAMSFPHKVEGWYWTPEVQLLKDRNLPASQFQILDSWEYVGWETRPFARILDMYNQRREMKAKGEGSEKAIKLAINSLYGKTAQRSGWERLGKAPTWHQLEWAGYITSHARAQLFSVMDKIAWNNIIAVETDGIYTRTDPATIGVSDSKDLGGWEVTEYDGLMYVQSGVYFYGTSKGIVGKYRGLDKGSLDSGRMESFLQTLGTDKPWEFLSGPTTRFVGYRAANHRYKTDGIEFKKNHRRWVTSTREIKPGTVGKRRHFPKLCKACRMGASAFDMPHDLNVYSLAYQEEVKSTAHFIPWENWGGEEPEWRAMEMEMEGLLV